VQVIKIFGKVVSLGTPKNRVDATLSNAHPERVEDVSVNNNYFLYIVIIL
jgi:hypothetical protein